MPSPHTYTTPLPYLPPLYPLLLLLLLLHHLIPMMGTPYPFSPLPAKLVLVGKGGERPLLVLLPPLPPSHLVLSSSTATLFVLTSSSDCEQDRCRALLHLDLDFNDFVRLKYRCFPPHHHDHPLHHHHDHSLHHHHGGCHHVHYLFVEDASLDGEGRKKTKTRPA